MVFTWKKNIIPKYKPNLDIKNIHINKKYNTQIRLMRT